MGCKESLVKYILFLTNLVFALSGLALLAVSVAFQYAIFSAVQMPDGHMQILPITFMVIGGIVFLISFFGCCGAIGESNCMLVTYSICMLVLMAIKLALAAMIFGKLDTVLEQISAWLGEQFKDQESFHVIEGVFHCCGVSGPWSYIVDLPNTCCPAPPCNILTGQNYSGCSPVLQGFFRTYGMAIGVLAIIVAAIELMAVFFGLCLASHVRNRYTRIRCSVQSTDNLILRQASST